MKKKLLLLAAVAVSFNNAFSQASTVYQAPLGPTTTQVRAPNGTSGHAFLRACSLVLPTELSSIPLGTTLSSFGFTMSTGTAPLSVTGNFVLYLESTANTTYQKGTNWPTIISTMTTAYASVMTIPNATGPTSIMVTLSTPLTYTGGGLYVAYDWQSTGPFNAAVVGNIATYYAQGTALSPGGASTAENITSPGNTLGTTAFRPSFLFGYNNPNSNDMQVIGIEAPGKVAGSFSTPHNVLAIVKNSSNAPLSNVTVSLDVTGANPSTDVQTISSLAAGAITTVTFAAYNPVTIGSSTLTVSVPADDNNLNNQATYGQDVTCSTWAQNPSTPAGTYTAGVGFGAGGGMIATPYLSVGNTTLTGLRAALSNDINAVGRSVYGVALTSAGTILATTNTLIITNPMLSTFQNFTFAAPQAFASGTTYYVGFVQIANATAYYPAGTLASAYVKPNTYFSAASTGGAFTPLATTFGYFGIESVFASTVTVSAPSQTVNCGTTATLNVTSNGTFTWSTGATTSTLAVTPTVNSVYTVNATSPSGCSATGNVSVTVTPLALSATSQTVICGDASTLTAVSASNYSWSTGATTSSISVTPTVTTVYTVTANNPAGCSTAKTATVTINPLQVAASVNSSTVCPGLPVTLSATGATSFIWGTTTGTLSNSNNFTDIPTTNTTYTVVGTNAAGCHALSAVAVTVNTAPNVVISTNTTAICLGSSVDFTASGASTYSWSIAGSTPTANISDSPLTTTEYSLSGTDAAGCISIATTTITVNSVSLSITGNTAVCSGSSASLNATGASNITWNGTFNFPTYNVTPTITTTYTVDGLESSTGCSSTETVVLIVNAKPAVTATASKTVFCKGESVTVNAGGASTYTWTGGTLSGAVASSINFTTVVLGAASYSVRGVDDNGCANTAAFTYSVDACLGIQQAGAIEANILVFPNPNSGVFTVSFKTTSTTASIEIYNTLGALVKKQAVDSENTVIDLKNESNGIYFINVTDNNKAVYTSKIVKH